MQPLCSASRFAPLAAWGRWLPCCLVCLACGCAPSAAPPAERPVPTPDAGSTSNAVPAETWEICLLAGAPAGYVHTQRTAPEGAADSGVAVHSESRLRLRRSGDVNELRVTLDSSETPAGRLLSFRCQTQFDRQTILVSGESAAGKLQVRTEQSGQTTTSEIAASENLGGFFAIERSLGEQPLQPGQTREVELLFPGLGEVLVARATLAAIDWEETPWLTGPPRRLLRTEVVTRLPQGNPLQTTLWTDERGEVLKSFVTALEQTTYRTTRELALAALSGDSPDLNVASLVPAPQQVQLHAARSARFHLRLEHGDVRQVFPGAAAQRVVRDDAGGVMLQTRAVRPTTELAGWPSEPPPTAADLAGNRWMQTDDPYLANLAQTVAGGTTDRWQQCLALERWVFEHLAKGDFSQTFATASETARTGRGDCTEHALLLATLARVLGIPSRVAAGLVYVGDRQAFGFHLWTEVWVADRWIGLDATLGRGGLGAGHLKLSQADLAGGSLTACLLPVSDVLGQLTILHIEAELPAE